MAKRFFKSSGVGVAAALISITSLLSYVVGLLRDRIIAVHFGTSAATDTYNASFIIPDVIFNLFIASALMAAFLPIFSDRLKKNKEEAMEIANTVLTGAVLLVSFLSAVAFIFMPYIVPFLFQEADQNMVTDIVNMTRIILGSAILFSISNTLGNILMSYKHFVAYALAPILYNLGIIFGILLLHEQMGIYSAATGVVIGAGLHCLIRIIDTMGTGYRFRPQFSFLHPSFKKIIKLMIPKSLSLVAWQINLYVFAVVGMSIQTGALAAFIFAKNIQSFPVSLFGIAFATAVFPYLSNAASDRNGEAYTHHVQKTIQRILFFTIPAAAGIMVMAKPLVELILSGGVFGEESIMLTSLILFFFGLSIPFESVSHILARAFYSLKNTLIPTTINIAGMAIIALITYFVAPIYGVQWFSIGFTLGFAFYMVVMIVFLRKHLSGFNFGNFFKSFGKIIVSTAIMVAVVISTAILEESMPEKLSHMLRIGIGAVTFFAIAALLRSEELNSIKLLMKKIIPSKTKPTPPA